MAAVESQKLLPCGSKLEGFEVDQRSSRRQRRAAVLAICAVAAVACVAASTVAHSLRSDELMVTTTKPSVELSARKPLDKADAYLEKHGIPSWLSTSSVSLKPLSTMIEEQLAVKKMSKEKADQAMAKQESKSTDAPTPHELAMKNALHSQAVSKVASKSVKVATATSTQSLKEVQKPVAQAFTTTAGAGPASGYHRGVIKAKEAGLKLIKREERKEELVIESAEEKKLKAIRAEEERVNKDEQRKLEKIKKADALREKNIMTELAALKKEKATEQLSEKRAIKAQMARIEDEERDKLEELKKKMYIIAKGGVLKNAKTASKSEVAATKPSGTNARGHRVVQKPVVKMHATGGSTKSAEIVKSSLKSTSDVASGCTTAKCDLKEEDDQWDEIGGKVDDYARKAAHAHGKAKADALAHMKFLQEQIEKDYKHVTGFAVAQEHALPPAPKMQ